MKSHYEPPAEAGSEPSCAAQKAAAEGGPSLGPRPGRPSEAFALHEHREVWDAIPWVVAGTATPEERRMVEGQVADNRCLGNELAWQQKIHRAMQDTPQSTDTAALDAGLARLWAREREADAALFPLPRARVGKQEADAVAASVVAGRSKNKRWLLVALTVQAMATLVLGLQFAGEPKPDDIGPGRPPGLPEAILRLVPHGQTDMNTLRRMLNQHGLRIVGADEAANSLLLAPLNPGPDPALSAVALLQNLRDEPGVMLVVPVVPQAPR